MHRFGEIRDRTYENQQHRASGLNFLITAIVLWNTRYLERAVTALRQIVDVPDHRLAHLLPLGWERINLTGVYVWTGTEQGTEGPDGLRRLRPSSEPTRLMAQIRGLSAYATKKTHCSLPWMPRSKTTRRRAAGAIVDDHGVGFWGTTTGVPLHAANRYTPFAITALRGAAPGSGGLAPRPGRCGRVPLVAITVSSASTSSGKMSTSANASHEPREVLAGRTGVAMAVCGFGAVDDDCAMACRPAGRHLQSNLKWRSCQHPLARAHYKHTLSVRFWTGCVVMGMSCRIFK
jgi:hypothetical protein